MKKILFIIPALAILFVLLAACKNDDDGVSDVTITVWVAPEEVELTRRLADAFIASYSAYNVTIEIEAVGEKDVWAEYDRRPDEAADVFVFPNTRLRDFIRAGRLQEITYNKDSITSRNSRSSVEAASLDGKLYAFPVAVTDGFFLYYDKSVLTEEDVRTLDGLLTAADEAGKKVAMNLYDNGWYVSSFFLGAGCTLTVDSANRQICDFNEGAGLAAAEAIRVFTSHNAYIDAGDDIIKNAIGGAIAAGVSRITIADDVAETLGENFGAVKLPTFPLGGEQVQMASFAEFTLLGVNGEISDSAKRTVAMAFADYLSNEASQLARFNSHSVSPTNTSAVRNSNVQENLAVAALAEQSIYASSEKDVFGIFWAPVGAFGATMVNGDATELQILLDNLMAQLGA